MYSIEPEQFIAMLETRAVGRVAHMDLFIICKFSLLSDYCILTTVVV